MQFASLPQRLIPSLSSVSMTQGARSRRFWFDAVAFLMVSAFLIFISWGAKEMSAPMGQLQQSPISLLPSHLPEYALRTTLRIFAAIVDSLVFTFVVATLAARSRKAELVILPALDILQQRAAG